MVGMFFLKNEYCRNLALHGTPNEVCSFILPFIFKHLKRQYKAGPQLNVHMAI